MLFASHTCPVEGSLQGCGACCSLQNSNGITAQQGAEGLVCMCMLQAQVAGQSPSVQVPPARPATASPSQEEEEEDQSPQQEPAQQQQADQPQAPVGPENGLHRPTDSTPGAVNATLQHLLQQSRMSRNQCWHPEEVPFSIASREACAYGVQLTYQAPGATQQQFVITDLSRAHAHLLTRHLHATLSLSLASFDLP